MVIIPGPLLLLFLILTAWWSYRRVERREYLILAVSVGIVYTLLRVLAHNVPTIYLYYHGPLGAAGFDSIHLPRAIAATAALSAVPLKSKALRIVLAVIAVVVGGMFIPMWIS